MPLSEQQKRQLIVNKGLDPSKYRVSDDENYIIPIAPIAAPEQQQEKQPVVATEPQQSSALGAGARVALEGAVPSLAGGAAFAAGMSPAIPYNAWAYGATVPSYGTSLLVPLASGLVSSLLGRKIAQAGQDVVTTDKWKEQIKEDVQTHPTAAFWGNIADIPLSGMSPSPSGVVKAASTLPKLTTGGGLTTEELGQLVNVGVGAGLGGGSAALEGGSWKDIGESAATGALFNKPNAIGRAMGFHPVGKGPLSEESLKKVLTQGEPMEVQPPMSGAVMTEPAPISPTMTYQEQATHAAGAPGKILSRPPLIGLDDLTQLQLLKLQPTTGEPTASTIKKGRAVGKPTELGYVPIKSAPESALHMEQLLKEGAPITPRELAIETEPWSPFASSSSKVSPNRLMSEKSPVRQDDTGAVTTLAQEVNQGLKNKDIPSTPTRQWFDLLKSFGAKMRNIRTQEDGSLSMPNGNPAAGEAVLREGMKEATAIINPENFGLDTQPHEMQGHIFLTDLANSTKPRDKKLMAQFTKLLQQDPEFLASGLSAEEFAASQQGLEFVKQQLNLAGESGVKTWWKDLLSHVKTKYGKDATIEDYRRLLNYRFVNDPAFASGIRLSATGDIVGEQRQMQEKSPLDNMRPLRYSEEDLIRYKQIKKQMSDMNDADVNGDAYMALWKEFETIRNKYNGNQPLQEVEQAKGKTPEEATYATLSTADKEAYSKLHSDAMLARQAHDNAATDETSSKLIDAELALKNFEMQKFGRQMQEKSQIEKPSFLNSAAELIRSPEYLRLQPNQYDAYNGTQLLGTLKNKISPFEWQLLEEQGIVQHFQNKWINREQAAKWIDEHSPVARIESYGMEGKVSEAKKEYDKMTHEWLEPLPREQRSRTSALDNVSAGWETAMRNQLTREGWTKENIDKAIQYNNLGKQVVNEPKDTSPRATSYYSSVSALPANEPMPEWTATKSGKNVQRVDVVIPVKEVYPYEEWVKRNYSNPKPEHEATYRKVYEAQLRNNNPNDPYKSVLNKTLWKPDNLHENLPNTLGWAMIQYKTGSKGEKIAVIVEAQSRWGQIVRGSQKAGESANSKWQQEHNHPLLRDYNRLILKAAIEQARKEGATHIMVSDAETAMMTEGHDVMAVKYAEPTPENVAKAKKLLASQYGNEHTKRELNELASGKQIALGGNGVYSSLEHEFNVTKKLEQEPGMRLNYDTVLPKIAEELTGSKGEKVSLGEHKNAYHNKRNPNQNWATDNQPQFEHNVKRDNLIFRNLDGSPKTDVSGLMFDISKIPDRQPMLLGRKFQESSPIIKLPNEQKLPSWIEDPNSIQSILYKAARKKYAETLEGKEFIAFKNYIKQKYFKGQEPFSWEDSYLKEPYTLQNEITDPDIGHISPEDLLKYHELSDKASKVWNDLTDIVMQSNKKVLRSGSEQINQEEKGYSTDFRLNQESSPIPRSNQPLADVQDTSKKGFLRPLEATFDKVERVSVPLAQVFRNWSQRRDTFLGMRNVAIKDLQQYDSADVNRVMQLHREAYRTNKELPQLPPKLAEISQVLSSYYGKIADVRQQSGLLINHRLPGKNKYYVPDQLNDTTLDLFINKSQSVEAKAAKSLWAEYLFNESGGRIGREEAKTIVSDYVAALGGKQTNYRSVEFGAIRKAAGYGLPERIREKDAIASLSKYGRRAAADLALYMEIESKPAVAAALKIKDPNINAIPKVAGETGSLSEAQEVKDAMKWVTNEFANTSSASMPKVNAFVRLVNNALLGTATGLRDTASIPMNMIPYLNKWEDLGAVIKGIAEIRKNSRQALLTAAKQPSIDRLQFNELLDSPDAFTAMMQKAGTLMRKLQGREAIENFNRDVTFSIGKELGRVNILGAQAGHKQSIQFLEKFKTLLPDNLLQLKGAELEQAINQIGKNFTDRNQGSYGGEGLPVGAIESQFAPFWALQKWSLEKSNVIYKDVVKPFITGENRLPALTYTLGSFLTGAAIQQLNQVLTGKKAQDPTLKEALEHGGADNMVAELATLMQLGSYAGLVGDVMKFASDGLIYGKTPRNIVSFPTATMALDFQDKTIDMAEAIRTGENPWDVFKEYAMDIMVKNVQAIRMIANNTVNKEEVQRTGKFRDLQTFRTMEGQTAKDFTKSNPYLNLEQKAYKKEDDVSKAVEQLPTLIAKIFEKADGNVEVLRRELAGLKANNYQTMPSPKQMPVTFMRYLAYLGKTQGPEAASARLTDYLRQNAINRAKAKAIPSL